MKNKLRVLRAEQNWSQAVLAEKVGVSRQTINAIETGKYDPSLPLAFKLAELFSRTIEEVFEPFLIMEGFIKRTSRGREATQRAYDHFKVKKEQGPLFNP